MRGCEGYVIFAQDGIRWAAGSDEKFVLEHFYAVFGLGCSRDLRVSSARAFGISENDISEDCSVPGGVAKRLRPLTHGTPRETHIQKKAKIDLQEIEAQPLDEVNVKLHKPQVTSNRQILATLATNDKLTRTT